MMMPVTRAAAIEIPDPAETALGKARAECARLRRENSILCQSIPTPKVKLSLQTGGTICGKIVSGNASHISLCREPLTNGQAHSLVAIR
jgi:hypothetical protein